MPLFSFEGLTPQVDAGAFVAPTATLVGDVIVEAGASIWYGAVIRADYAPVIVRRGANVQDNAVIHGPPGLTTDIGPGATVGHNCVVHGATLGAECLVANGSVVLDGATVGAKALVAAGSDPNIRVQRIRDVFDREFPDRAKLSKTAGFSIDDIPRIVPEFK